MVNLDVQHLPAQTLFITHDWITCLTPLFILPTTTQEAQSGVYKVRYRFLRSTDIISEIRRFYRSRNIRLEGPESG